MQKYVYNGPVMAFNYCIANNWYGETMAESEAKAKNNLLYQFKKGTGIVNGSKLTLPGRLTIEIERGNNGRI